MRRQQEVALVTVAPCWRSSVAVEKARLKHLYLASTAHNVSDSASHFLCLLHTSKSCMCCSTRLVLCATTTGRPTVSRYVKCSSRLPSSITNGAFSWMSLQKDCYSIRFIEKKITGAVSHKQSALSHACLHVCICLLCMLYNVCVKSEIERDNIFKSNNLC